MESHNNKRKFENIIDEYSFLAELDSKDEISVINTVTENENETDDEDSFVEFETNDDICNVSNLYYETLVESVVDEIPHNYNESELSIDDISFL